MSDLEVRLQSLRRPDAPVWTLHYACESWFHVTDRPVAVSCISLVRASDRSEIVLSQTDAKERAEEHLLERFYGHLRTHPDALLVHWNMHSSDFGFEAVRNRYRYLFSKEPPYSPPEANKIDLDNLIAERFGPDFADHPKLPSVAELNGFKKRYMLSGKEEAEKFASNSHGEIRRSTTEKAKLIAFLLHRLLNDKLVTKNSSSLVRFAEQRLDAVQILVEIGERIENVRRQLLHRHDGRPTLKVDDEYDFQDLYHALLRLFFDDVRREETTPSHGGASGRVDFVLPEPHVAVELKHSRERMTAKTLGEELMVDAQRYAAHPHVDTLMCLVLDRDGRIDNPRGLERDLSKVTAGVRVVVRIIDR